MNTPRENRMIGWFIFNLACIVFIAYKVLTFNQSDAVLGALIAYPVMMLINLLLGIFLRSDFKFYGRLIAWHITAMLIVVVLEFFS